MGTAFSNAVKGIFGGAVEKRILLVGLDAVGKTTIVHKLKLGETVTTIPTIGFNVETVTYKNVKLTMWDIGGTDKLGPVKRHYYHGVQVVIFVVDSNDRDRIDDARFELHEMNDRPELHEAIFLVFANKQDLPNAMSVAEIHSRLGLRCVCQRCLKIQPCSAFTGEGLYEGLDWIAEKDVILQSLAFSKARTGAWDMPWKSEVAELAKHSFERIPLDLETQRDLLQAIDVLADGFQRTRELHPPSNGLHVERLQTAAVLYSLATQRVAEETQLEQGVLAPPLLACLFELLAQCNKERSDEPSFRRSICAAGGVGAEFTRDRERLQIQLIPSYFVKDGRQHVAKRNKGFWKSLFSAESTMLKPNTSDEPSVACLRRMWHVLILVARKQYPILLAGITDSDLVAASTMYFFHHPSNYRTSTMACATHTDRPALSLIVSDGAGLECKDSSESAVPWKPQWDKSQKLFCVAITGQMAGDAKLSVKACEHRLVLPLDAPDRSTLSIDIYL